MVSRTSLRTADRFFLLAAFAGTVGGAIVAAPEPKPESPTKEELTGITHLHRYAVKLFIDRNGFGFHRMDPPLTDVLAPPKSQAQAPVAQHRAENEPLAIKPDKDGKPGHFSFAKAVGEAKYIPSPDAKKSWVVKEVQLVGLVKHKDPVVYLSDNATDEAMKEKKEEKTRQPDKFETKALEVIRGGGELVQAEKTGGTIRAVSGIYAGKQCAACHERSGEMLGAFSYKLALEEAPAKVGKAVATPKK